MFPDGGPFRRALYPRHMEVIEATADCNQVAFIAANKVGKTELGCYCLATWLSGEYPSWWRGRRFDHATTIWTAGEKNAVVRDSVQLKLLGPLSDIGTGLIRGPLIERATRKSGLADAIDTVHVRHVSGGVSTLRFKSYEEGREAFQSTDLDVIHLDEEPKMEIYTEAFIRTMVREGLALLTFTPLNGWDEVVELFLAHSVAVTE
jgi:phage terminase large subunit-like protein